jgi:hypothetical protein
MKLIIIPSVDTIHIIHINKYVVITVVYRLLVLHQNNYNKKPLSLLLTSISDSSEFLVKVNSSAE